MAFVTICKRSELPPPGQMRERAAGGRTLCIANQDGHYAVLDNLCPHRGGPLAEGLLEEGKALCPWHAWAFDLKTGWADHDPDQRVRVYAVRMEEETVEVDLDP